MACNNRNFFCHRCRGRKSKIKGSARVVLLLKALGENATSCLLRSGGAQVSSVFASVCLLSVSAPLLPGRQSFNQGITLILGSYHLTVLNQFYLQRPNS